jgi:fibronectin-binding autotransporter adhesin
MKTTLKSCLMFLVVSAALMLGRISVQAASQVWTNAPVDNSWTNVANWAGGAFPGASNTTTTADSATFNTAIPVSGIGGAGDPITNGFDQGIASLFFNTASCGAYVFGHSLNDSALQLVQNGGNQNANITIGSAVVNPIIFNESLDFRGASSQTYFLGITNNATAATAALYVPAITNLANSTTRQWIINLAGANTGTNTIGHLDSNNGAEGAMLLDVWGGRWIFSGPNNGADWPQKTSASAAAHVIVHAGILEAQDPESLGGVTVANFLVTNGVLQIDGVSLTNNGITLGQAGEILMNGTGTNQQITIPGASVTATLATANAGSTMVVSNISGGVTTATIDISGAGMVLLSSNSTYSGTWVIQAGTFQVGGSTVLPAGGGLTIDAGGQFDVSPLGAVSYTLPFTTFAALGTGTTAGSTAASLNAASGGTVVISSGISLNYAPTSFTGDATHPALYIPQGTLSIGGNTFQINNTSGTPLGAGTYVLAQQASGNITSTGTYAVNVIGSGLAAGDVGAVQVSGGQVQLVVAVYVPQNLTWKGGNPNENWDVNTTLNWLDGGSPSVFKNSDNVTFNATGSANPIVNVAAPVSPGSMLVDTTAANYSFGGSQGIVGPTGLTKMGTGTLVISNLNNGYLGSTVISNGTIQAGGSSVFSAASDVTISNVAVLDLNSYTNNIGALNGNGTVDTVAGGAAVVVVGSDSHSGNFSGTIKNTAGTLGVTMTGTGTETLSSANTYTGATMVNIGTLRASNPNALGSGGSAVTINSGILDVSSPTLKVASIAGTGSIANNSTTTTNELIVLGSSTFPGVIGDGTGGGGISVLVSAGTFEFTGLSTYSGGTIVASGATLAVAGAVTPGNAPGTGGILASNGATLSMPTATSAAEFFGNAVTTVNNATVEFTSAETANGWTGVFIGGINSTDVFSGGNMTIGGNGNNLQTFSNFLGQVYVTNGTVRSFGALNGGDNTPFNLIMNGAWNMRDGGANYVHFGSLSGDFSAVIGNITTPAGGTIGPAGGNYIIGGLNTTSIYSGAITGTNNIIKTGTGKLILNGGNFIITNNYISGITPVNYVGYESNQMTFLGTTTISNGVLALVTPEALSNCTSVVLASPSAVLDGSAMGFLSNQFDSDGVTITNQFPVTNSIFEVVSTEAFSGPGTLIGILDADAGSYLNPGNPTVLVTNTVLLDTNVTPTGVMNVTGAANIGGLVNMSLNTTNPVIADELTASSFVVSNTASLVVTNAGPVIVNGTTFTLFNHAVSFTSVTLPPAPYVWQNNLAVNGTITLVSGGSAAGPTPFTAPPHVSTIALSGANLLLTGTNGQAGDVYYTLSTTNLLLPVNQWIPVGTNIMPTANNFSITVTNAVNLNDPRQFFLLSNTNF